MRKALTITLVGMLALFAGGAAYANYCARDVVPASTILVPYVIQAWDHDAAAGSQALQSGYGTLLAITNVSSEATIIHITVWNAESEVAIDFDEVLSGYDVWTINFADMLNNNPAAFATSVAATWKANVDKPVPADWKGGPAEPVNDTLYRRPFEWGPDGRSAYQQDPNLTVPAWENGLDDPEPTNAVITNNCKIVQTKFQAANFDYMIDTIEAPLFARGHTECDLTNEVLPPAGTADTFAVRSDFDNDWLSAIPDIEDATFIWYYVTVDTVNFCNLDYPGTDTYFDGTYRWLNTLMGDIIYLNKAANYSEAINAVHIENGIEENSVNFYNPVQQALDTHLEPLATALAFRYLNVTGTPNGGASDVTTEVMLWKNHTEFDTATPFDSISCYPYVYYTWDNDEHSSSRGTGDCPVSPCLTDYFIDPNEFPFETQSVPVTTANFDLVDSVGWMLIVWPPSYGDFTDYTVDDYEDFDYQAWAGVKYLYKGYSAALEAATIANAHCFPEETMPSFATLKYYQQ